jgi:hypothetical protein
VTERSRAASDAQAEVEARSSTRTSIPHGIGAACRVNFAGHGPSKPLNPLSDGEVEIGRHDGSSRLVVWKLNCAYVIGRYFQKSHDEVLQRVDVDPLALALIQTLLERPDKKRKPEILGLILQLAQPLCKWAARSRAVVEFASDKASEFGVVPRAIERVSHGPGRWGWRSQWPRERGHA